MANLWFSSFGNYNQQFPNDFGKHLFPALLRSVKEQYPEHSVYFVTNHSSQHNNKKVLYQGVLPNVTFCLVHDPNQFLEGFADMLQKSLVITQSPDTLFSLLEHIHRIRTRNPDYLKHVIFYGYENCMQFLLANKLFMAHALRRTQFIPRTILLSLEDKHTKECHTRIGNFLKKTEAKYSVIKFTSNQSSLGRGVFIVQSDKLKDVFEAVAHGINNVKNQKIIAQAFPGLNNEKKARLIKEFKEVCEKRSMFLVQEYIPQETAVINNQEYDRITRVVASINETGELIIHGAWHRLADNPRISNPTNETAIVGRTKNPDVKQVLRQNEQVPLYKMLQPLAQELFKAARSANMEMCFSDRGLLKEAPLLSSNVFAQANRLMVGCFKQRNVPTKSAYKFNHQSLTLFFTLITKEPEKNTSATYNKAFRCLCHMDTNGKQLTPGQKSNIWLRATLLTNFVLANAIQLGIDLEEKNSKDESAMSYLEKNESITLPVFRLTINGHNKRLQQLYKTTKQPEEETKLEPLSPKPQQVVSV